MCFLVIIKSSGLWKNPSLTSLKCQVTVTPLYLVFLELFLELLEIVKCRTISWFQDIFNLWSHYVAPVANSIWFIIFIYLFNYLFSSFSCDQVLADVHHLLKGSLVWKVVQDDPSVHCRSQRVNILKISKASATFKWQTLDLWSSCRDIFCFIDCIVETESLIVHLIRSDCFSYFTCFLLFFLPSLMSQWNWTVSWVLEVQKDLLHCVN